ncbi:MAG TPA: GvpL/GvpF family gas vesicle protein [Isosphaeraceae bacterium]|jgi:hypothetical protein
MSYLAYAIARDPGPDLPATSSEGVPLDRVVADGLEAIVSVVPAGYATPGLPRLQAYARTVDELHRRGTVLPLRFGCLLETAGEIAALLDGRRAEFLAALDQVDGCEEMGLRVWLGTDAAPPPPEALAAAGPHRPGAGLAYLAARRARLAQQDARGAKADQAVTRIRDALRGTYVRYLVRDPGVGPLVALNFLIRREDRDPFWEAFERLQEQGCDPVLLSGPWPPYHFVSPPPEPTGALSLGPTHSAARTE